MTAHGLLMVHTGEGKGKTTAALGLALRALGQRHRVLMIQFVKEDTDTGEYLIAKRLAPEFELRTMGLGFVFGEWSDEDIAAARDAWTQAQAEINSGQWDMIILDEFTYCLRSEVIPPAEAVAAFTSRPPKLHLVITGRDAPEELMAAADLVTEMTCIKHPFEAGISAQRGIEF